MEVVHVELSDERIYVTVLEIHWKNSLGESLDVFYNEEVTAFTPTDDSRMSFIFKKIIGLFDE